MQGCDHTQSAHAGKRQIQQDEVDVRVGCGRSEALCGIGSGNDVNVVPERFESGCDPFLH